MALNYMTGTPEERRRRVKNRVRRNQIIINPDSMDEMSGFWDTIKTKFKEAKKSIRDAAEEVKKKGGQRIAKIGLAPARGGFLIAVNNNVLKLATKLAQLWKKNPQKVKDFWTNFGGEPDKLKRAIENGSKQALTGMDQLGSITTALASAVPILIKIYKLFKENGLTSPEDEQKEKVLVDQAKSVLELDPNYEKDFAKLPKDETGRTAEVVKVKPGEEPTSPAPTEPVSTPFYKKPAVLIGGAVAVAGIIYLATRKRK